MRKLKYLLLWLVIFLIPSNTNALEVLSTTYSNYTYWATDKMYKTSFAEENGVKSPFLFPSPHKFCTKYWCNYYPNSEYTNGKYIFHWMNGNNYTFYSMTHWWGKTFYGDEWNGMLYPIWYQWDTFYMGLDVSSLGIDWASNVLMKYESNPLEKIKTRRGTEIYSKVALRAYWLSYFSISETEFKSSALILNNYVMNWFMPYWVGGDNNNELWLIDTYKNKVYIYNNWVLSFKNQFREWFFNFFYYLRNQKPDKIAEIYFNAWTDTLWVSNVPWWWGSTITVKYLKENERAWIDEDLVSLRNELRDSLLIMNNSLYFLKVDMKELWLGGDAPINPEDPLLEYNKCFTYYSAIKTYTNADRECYRGLMDKAPLTWSYDMNALLSEWNAVSNWDWEWEWPKTTDHICWLFKWYKRAYKQKYADKWEEFKSISAENWLAPQGIDIKGYCGEKPKDKSLIKKIVDWVSDYWNKITGKETVGKKDWKSVSKKDLDKSLINLWLLKQKCDNPSAYMWGVPMWQIPDKLSEYKAKFCSEYKKALKDHNDKFWNIEYDEKYKDEYSTWSEVDNLWLSKILTYFFPSYESWFNFVAGKMWICKNQVITEEWDFLVYVPFLMISFLIVKYMFF